MRRDLKSSRWSTNPRTDERFGRVQRRVVGGWRVRAIFIMCPFEPLVRTVGQPADAGWVCPFGTVGQPADAGWVCPGGHMIRPNECIIKLKLWAIHLNV